MNWWPIVISGGTFLLVNVTIIIGYIKNHSKHIEMRIAALKEAQEKGNAEIKEDIDNIYTKLNTNATDIAKIQGRLNSKR